MITSQEIQKNIRWVMNNIPSVIILYLCQMFPQKMPHLTHTKIYGQGIKCLLQQAGISGNYKDGVLRIEIEDGQTLIILATEDKILHFFIEAEVKDLVPSF